MVKISHIFLMALLTLGSANALFAAKSKSAVKKVGGGNLPLANNIPLA